MGLISGFFKKTPKKGRPKKNSIFMNSLPPNKKTKEKNKDVDPPTTTIDLTVNPLLPTQSQAAAVRHAHPPSKVTKTRPHSSAVLSSSRNPYKKDASSSPTKKRNRGIYRDWTKEEPYKSALAKAIQVATKGLDPQEAAGYIYTPPMTLLRAMAKIAQHEEELMEEHGVDFAYLSKFERKHVHVTNKQASLTSEDDCEFLQKLITLRDKNKNGMSRIECIGTLMVITMAHKRKAELHVDHL